MIWLEVSNTAKPDSPYAEEKGPCTNDQEVVHATNPPSDHSIPLNHHNLKLDITLSLYPPHPFLPNPLLHILS